jgi:hypothetical protein
MSIYSSETNAFRAAARLASKLRSPQSNIDVFMALKLGGESGRVA